MPGTQCHIMTFKSWCLVTYCLLPGPASSSWHSFLKPYSQLGIGEGIWVCVGAGHRVKGKCKMCVCLCCVFVQVVLGLDSRI